MHIRKHVLDVRGTLHTLIVALLVVAIAVTVSLDSPEEFETALKNKQQLDTSQLATGYDSVKSQRYSHAESIAGSKHRKARHFDEDYIIVWLSAKRPYFGPVGVSNDVSTVKYRSFYSLGNIDFRYLPLVKYRDFVDMYNQQYGRSVH